MTGFAIGVDVGGTFTDVVVAGPAGLTVAKAPTTPEDQSEGVMAGLADAAARLGLELGAMLGATTRVMHGTTVATNALLEGRGARVAMLVTEGHRDVIEMREGLKPDRYDLRMPPPEPLVDRSLRIGVRERMRWDGSVATALDRASLDAAVRRLGAAGIASVAICFLHSWANPSHERAAAAVVQRALPAARVSCSADVLPEIKEFERFSTTVANALVAPLVGDYLRRLEARLRAAGLPGPLYVMLSHGGVASVAEAARLAAATALSGPAGGVAAGVALAAAAGGSPSSITFDMGGTSTDIAVLRDGRAALGGGRSVGPVRIGLPSLDIVTLGAGGGSIAWVGPDGLLRVGPQSAGSRPGPACLGQGGEAATVTDASLVLGYLDASAGGRQRLDAQLAEAALGRLGAPLGLDAVAAAAGVHRVVTARMADGVRVATVQRGVDPRAFRLVSFGGAAGLQAAAVAAALGIGTVVVPVQASVLSAWGMLNTDLVVHASRGVAGGTDAAALEAGFASLMAEGAARLAWFDGALSTQRSIDMRYGEQVFEISVSLDGIDLTAADAMRSIEARFHDRHEALFTYALRDQEVVMTTLRVSVAGALPRLAPEARVELRPREECRIFVDRWIDAPVRGFGDWSGWLPGPALIRSATTTVLVRPADRVRFDARGWLELSVGGVRDTPRH